MSIGPPRVASPFVVAGSPVCQLLEDKYNNATATTESGPASNASTLRFPRPSALEPSTNEPTYDSIEVRISGATIDYQLDADDVANVFGRLTTVHNVHVDPEVPSRAVVDVAWGTGQEVAQLLNGHHLQGIEGNLSAIKLPSAPSPTNCTADLIDLFFDRRPRRASHGVVGMGREGEFGATEPAISIPQTVPCGPTAPSPALSAAAPAERSPVPPSTSPPQQEYLNLLLDLCRSSPVDDEGTPAWTDPLRSPPNFCNQFSPHTYDTPLTQRYGGSPWTSDAFSSPMQGSPFGDPFRQVDTGDASPGALATPPSNRRFDTNSAAGGNDAVDIENGRPRVRKWTARYDIQIDPEEAFQVTRRIIGTRGAHMKRINQATGAKLRLRGKGSGYLEGSSRQEAEDPLHLCISSCDATKYRVSRQMTEKLLRSIYADYDVWVAEQGGNPPRLHIRYRELFLPTRSREEDPEWRMNRRPGTPQVYSVNEQDQSRRHNNRAPRT